LQQATDQVLSQLIVDLRVSNKLKLFKTIDAASFALAVATAVTASASKKQYYQDNFLNIKKVQSQVFKLSYAKWLAAATPAPPVEAESSFPIPGLDTIGALFGAVETGVENARKAQQEKIWHVAEILESVCLSPLRELYIKIHEGREERETRRKR
jgi:hypothetical protein